MPSEREIAEIEAVIRQELDWPEERDPDGAVAASLRRIGQRIAALRAKDREDGAREMRERAAEAAHDEAKWQEYWDGQPICYAIAAAIKDLPLTPKESGDA